MDIYLLFGIQIIRKTQPSTPTLLCTAAHSFVQDNRPVGVTRSDERDTDPCVLTMVAISRSNRLWRIPWLSYILSHGVDTYTSTPFQLEP